MSYNCRTSMTFFYPWPRIKQFLGWHALRVTASLLFVFAAATTCISNDPDLTFFGWSDQHVQTDGNGKHLEPAIAAMNRLPGTPYPDSIGGTVDKPAFVFGCGDITEWPTHAALDTFVRLVTDELHYPVYNVIGNHDEGGKVPSETVKRWLIAQHGGLSYTFSAGGIRFICVYSKYDESLNNPAQPLTDAALKWLNEELAKVPPTTPTIVATHLCYDALTNRDQLIEILAPYRVLMILGGHYHKAKVDHYRGRYFIQLPSPAPGSPSEFMVIRITGSRIVAVPYDYAKNQWAPGPGRLLDVEIK